MSTLPLRLAVAFARGWTAIYTWRLPPEIAEERRGEIASDLAESQLDPSQHRTALAAQIVFRVLRGVPDDLGWRWTEVPNAWPTGALVVIVAAITVFVAWTVFIASARVLPPVPPATPWQARSVRAPLPFPPPPPPPPCPPSSIDRDPIGCAK